VCRKEIRGHFERRGGGAAAIPVFDEKLRVGKIVRETDRVLIRTSVLERTEVAELELHSGDAIIERVPVDRLVDATPAIRQEGDTVIIPVVEEIMVIEKRLLLKEEIHIRRQEVVQHVRQPVRLRSEQVSLERQSLADSDNITAKED
jgi:stress response protein YsnF